MIVQKNGITYELNDQTQIDAFVGSGWVVMPENEQPFEQPDLASMTDEQLAEIATEKGIDLSKMKTREQLIKVLEK